MKFLVIDIGGTNVKMLASGHDAPRRFPSGKEMTPLQMIAGVFDATKDWEYEAISIGFPGPVLGGQPMTEPVNLGPGWIGFDFEAAFHRPVKVMNDAAMQALGSYQGGKMLFIGLGTGFGAAVIMDGVIEPLELGRFHYRKRTLEHYVGARGRKRLGQKKWQRHVQEVVERLIAALKPDDVVLGGGNAKKLKPLPAGTRLGNNSFAFEGGFRIWHGDAAKQLSFSPLPCGGEGSGVRGAVASSTPPFTPTLSPQAERERRACDNSSRTKRPIADDGQAPRTADRLEVPR